MKILNYNYSFQTNIGGGTHAREVFKALKELPNVEVDPFPSPAIEAGAQTLLPKKAKLRWLPESVAQWIRFWLRPVENELQSLEKQNAKSYDAVFFRPNTLLRLIPAMKRRFPSTHLCVEINSFIHSECLRGVWPNGFWMWREAALINHADSVMVVSDYLKKQMLRLGISEEKILVNPNGVNLALFGKSALQQREASRKGLGLPSDAFVLGYVGGMETFRKLPLMVAQVLEIMQDDDRLHLVMAGDGVDRKNVEQVLSEAPLDVRNRVHFNGAVPYENVPVLMSSFDCALFPYSNPYGSPQKLFEYMAMGIPVIGPDVPVVREVFQDQKHLLLAQQTGADFKTLVKRLVADPEGRIAIARQGQDLVLEEYTWHNNAKRLIGFLNNRAGKTKD